LLLSENLPQLEEAIRDLRPDLIVIDPLQAFIPGNVDLHRANEVREALAGISKLAERYSFALLIVFHLNKSTQSKAIHRILGSIDLAAGARSIMVASRRAGGETYALAHLKCSVGPKGPTLLYSIDTTGLHWLGTEDTTADDLLNSTDEPQKKTNAQSLLKDLLSNGPQSAKEVFALAARNGLTDGCMRAADRSLRVQQKPSDFRGQWLWSLPVDDTPKVMPISVEGESQTK
jgi:hypothetical protein